MWSSRSALDQLQIIERNLWTVFHVFHDNHKVVTKKRACTSWQVSVSVVERSFFLIGEQLSLWQWTCAYRVSVFAATKLDSSSCWSFHHWHFIASVFIVAHKKHLNRNLVNNVLQILYIRGLEFRGSNYYLSDTYTTWVFFFFNIALNLNIFFFKLIIIIIYKIQYYFKYSCVAGD